MNTKTKREAGDKIGTIDLTPAEQHDTAQPADWQKIAIGLKAELDKSKAHAQRLAEALAIIRAEMNALYRDEPKPDKRLSRLGARFDWNLVVYEPLAAWERSAQ